MDKKWAPGLLMRKKIGMMANGWKLRRTDEEWERGQRIDRKWWKVHQFEAEIRVYLSNKQAAVKEKWYLYIICWVVKKPERGGMGRVQSCTLYDNAFFQFCNYRWQNDFNNNYFFQLIKITWSQAFKHLLESLRELQVLFYLFSRSIV